MMIEEMNPNMAMGRVRIAVNQVDGEHRLAIVPDCSRAGFGGLKPEGIAPDLPRFLGLDFSLGITVSLLHLCAWVYVRADPMDVSEIAQGIDGDPAAISLDGGVVLEIRQRGSRAGAWLVRSARWRLRGLGRSRNRARQAPRCTSP